MQPHDSTKGGPAVTAPHANVLVSVSSTMTLNEIVTLGWRYSLTPPVTAPKSATETKEPTWIAPERAAELAALPMETEADRKRSLKRIYTWAEGRRWASRPTKRCLRIEQTGFLAGSRTKRGGDSGQGHEAPRHLGRGRLHPRPPCREALPHQARGRGRQVQAQGGKQKRKPAVDPCITLKDYLPRFLADCQEGKVAPSTLTVRADVHQSSAPDARADEDSDIAPSDIRTLLHSKRQEGTNCQGQKGDDRTPRGALARNTVAQIRRRVLSAGSPSPFRTR